MFFNKLLKFLVTSHSTVYYCSTVVVLVSCILFAFYLQATRTYLTLESHMFLYWSHLCFACESLACSTQALVTLWLSYTVHKRTNLLILCRCQHMNRSVPHVYVHPAVSLETG